MEVLICFESHRDIRYSPFTASMLMQHDPQNCLSLCKNAYILFTHVKYVVLNRLGNPFMFIDHTVDGVSNSTFDWEQYPHWRLTCVDKTAIQSAILDLPELRIPDMIHDTVSGYWTEPSCTTFARRLLGKEWENCYTPGQLWNGLQKLDNNLNTLVLMD